jgi:DUF1009 family protein
LGVDVGGGEAGVAQHHVRDLRISAAGEVVASEVAVVAVDGAEGCAERFARGAAIGQQCAVDVEQNESQDARA